MHTTLQVPLPPKIAGLGEIIQLAYVPQDFDAAIHFWTRKMGVGPFFCVEHVVLDRIIHRGAPTKIDYSLAVSQWGDIQIELIQQHDQVPSIFRAWKSDALHHMQIAVPDYEGAVRNCKEQGFDLAMECLGVPGAPDFKVGFCELGPGAPAGFIELACFPDPMGMRTMVARIKEHVQKWDGRDPLRPIAKL